jgi:WD40 repeat protein
MSILCSIDATKEVKLWDVEAGSHALTLPAVHKAQIANSAWSPQGDLLATAAKDKTLRGTRVHEI